MVNLSNMKRNLIIVIQCTLFCIYLYQLLTSNDTSSSSSWLVAHNNNNNVMGRLLRRGKPAVEHVVNVLERWILDDHVSGVRIVKDEESMVATTEEHYVQHNVDDDGSSKHRRRRLGISDFLDPKTVESKVPSSDVKKKIIKERSSSVVVKKTNKSSGSSKAAYAQAYEAHHDDKNNNNNNNIHQDQEEEDEDGNSSAFCLLIKDDNDLLSEWIAYHYHTFNMRRLIVAMDPTSQTTPKDILETWSINFDDLIYTLWTDEDYMPLHFFFHTSTTTNDTKKEDYTKIPWLLGWNEVTLSTKVNGGRVTNTTQFMNTPIKSTVFHSNSTFVKYNQDKVRHDLLMVNNHYYRQKTFISECYRQIKREGQEEEEEAMMMMKKKKGASKRRRSMPSWTVHIDTDEFLVPNTWIWPYIQNKPYIDDIRKDDTTTNHHNGFTPQSLKEILPPSPSSGSLWNFFKRFRNEAEKNVGGTKGSETCVMMPRWLFGSHEDSDSSSTTTATTTEDKASTTTTRTTRTSNAIYNHTKFETLRWKYHQSHHETTQHKAIVNVAKLSYNEYIFKEHLANPSVHQPIPHRLQSKTTNDQGEQHQVVGCVKKNKMYYNQLHNEWMYEQPLGVHHYLGSYERFMHKGDERRNEERYYEFANVARYAKGDLNEKIEYSSTSTSGNGGGNDDADDENKRKKKNKEEEFQWWIGRWLDSFVTTHDDTKILNVLGEGYIVA